MIKITPLSRREFLKKLKKMGFEGPYSGGRHEYYRKNQQKIFVPNPHGKDLGVLIIREIIKQIGVHPEDFYKK